MVEPAVGAPGWTSKTPPGFPRRVAPAAANGFVVAETMTMANVVDDRVSKWTQNRRLRQLFATFLFAAFLQQAYAWLRHEESLVDATGVVRVAFVQLVRPEAVGAPLITAMNAEGSGLASLAPWYAAERGRYTGSGGPVLVAGILGPWVTDVDPPAIPERDPTWIDQLSVSFAFPRYFHDLAWAHGVDPDAYGARVYIVYGDDAWSDAADSRGSRKGRPAVAFVPTSSTLAYAQVAVAHELGHILGGLDLYDSSFFATFPAGYVEPWKDPLFPQRFAELMAVDIPLTARSEREVSSLDQVRVGFQTAADFGWIPEIQAETYYATRGASEALPTRTDP